MTEASIEAGRTIEVSDAFSRAIVQRSWVVRELLPTEWAVLGLLSRHPQHGFALAKSLCADGEFGRIWTVRRPLAYRALDTLRADGLIEFQGAEPGDGGPPRRKTLIPSKVTGLSAVGFTNPYNTSVTPVRCSFSSWRSSKSSASIRHL